ncbi:MAG: TolB family protein, partial [Candidatus Aquicultor sp.]
MSLIREIKRIVPTVLLAAFLFIISSVIVTGCSSGRTTKQPVGNEPVAGKTKVVFSEWGNENGRIISAISTVALGVGKRELLFKQNGQVDGLKVSPDNKRLAYFTSPDLLYLVDLNGENRRTLDDSVLGWANWSPDSRRLAYVKTITKSGKDKKHLAKYNVVVINYLDGSGRKTFGLGKFRSVPCAVLGWYPNGKQLAVYASGGSEAANTLLKVDLTTRK